MPSYYHRYWCSICYIHPSHCCHSCPCHHCHRRCHCCRQVHYYCHSYRLHHAGLTTANAIAICCHVLSLIIPFIVIIFNQIISIINVIINTIMIINTIIVIININRYLSTILLHLRHKHSYFAKRQIVTNLVISNMETTPLIGKTGAFLDYFKMVIIGFLFCGKKLQGFMKNYTVLQYITKK